jgi:hypothetical protein
MELLNWDDNDDKENQVVIFEQGETISGETIVGGNKTTNSETTSDSEDQTNTKSVERFVPSLQIAVNHVCF